ncbi:zinc sigma-54-dependent two-component system [Desulfocucumis palustris]|uniref:Zinc sigma-54-dependent two-component system n=1 Tax=Desulfocucumis palustris TaxID=1898651 RepID=A0A2L2XCJ7_9FIRM|nr:sigma 54-interacting transcriptional regulator [Desulfocucumis palustris]GBF33724.1 zinc sigma-54-dependent two-component system [Desulfocucumis palustris]
MQNKSNRFEMIRLWEKLNKSQFDPDISIHKYIYQSWERSKQYNVDPFKPTNTDILSKEAFNQLLRSNHFLLDLAAPSMADIYNYTKGSSFCVALSDKNGWLLKVIGDDEELAFTNYSNFSEGSNWSEKVMGTNSIGLALALDQPVQVYGYEHYCKCATLSTCSAAPIHNEYGDIIGVLDLTGPYKHVNIHTLGIVVAATSAIERKILLEKAYNEVNLANSLKQTVMESISEGIIVINENKRVIHINKRAGHLLGIDTKDNLGLDIESMLPNNSYFINLITSCKHIYGESVLIKTQKGKKKFMINCTPLVNEINNKKIGSVCVFHELHSIVSKIMRPRSTITFDSLIGETSTFQSALEQAKMASETDSNVLLLGESGVGKELFAHAIHNASNRNNETFITVNCGAIPRELISSELFGYEEGAFTGARKGGHPGKFELADQGTIFLDEIGEMPIDLQTALLRVLEDKTVTRVGGHVVIPTNIRLICATNKNLLEGIKNNNFRNDLYYRLNVISITIPSLRNRKGDIPILADYFMRTISARVGKKIDKIEPNLIDILLEYDWPGNIRELSNVIERAINLSRNNTLTTDLLPPEIYQSSSGSNISLWRNTPTKEDVEEQLIRNYLLKFEDNKSEVAKALNISRSCLYRKMSKYNIK